MKLLAVPSFRQTPGHSTCGPATLKMLLMYWKLPGAEFTDVEIGERCGTNADLGTSPTALVAGAAKFGLTLSPKHYASFDDIMAWLDKKIPVVVDWFAPPTKDDEEHVMADGHYSIVVALDETSIYLQDPELGALRTIAREEFLRVWFDFEGNYIQSPEHIFIRSLFAAYPTENETLK